jgi:hypothetical protein
VEKLAILYDFQGEYKCQKWGRDTLVELLRNVVQCVPRSNLNHASPCYNGLSPNVEVTPYSAVSYGQAGIYADLRFREITKQLEG